VVPGADGQTRAGADVVLVRLGEDRYALPLAGISEVGRPGVLTRVPGVPGWVAGVTNWRGRVLAVLDLAVLLRGQPCRPERRSRLIVVQAGPGGSIRVGVLVDQVVASTVLPDQVDPSPAQLAPAARRLLRGQLVVDGVPCGVLDLDAVAGLAAELRHERRAG